MISKEIQTDKPSQSATRRFGMVEIELFKQSGFFQFFFSLKEKQNKINRAPATDETQSSLHLLFAVGEK